MPSLLALAPYPYQSADTRYRIAQFIPGLEKAGWQVTLHPFMDDALFNIYNLPSHTFEKLSRTLARIYSRLLDCMHAKRYDVILLHKEAFMFGPPIMEALLRLGQPRIIYDMDDAFWAHPPQIPQIGRVLRDPNRIKKIIRMSKHVLAGNEYLAAYARDFNQNVTIFPTVLDTVRYSLRKEQPDNVVTIGWVGRWSSSAYLDSLLPVFEQLSNRFPNVSFQFVGAGEGRFPTSLRYKKIPWALAREIEDITAFDIGIMPLPDDIYSQGKCGLKLLQYMALGIPGVASPIGVNRQIIQDGENGFFASSESEWVEKISLLIKDPGLRKKIGKAARQTVIEHYSLQKAIPILIHILEQINE